ncbi:recombinase family protein [Mycobacterium avium]|uniref:Integrase n=1 Tax=Mycobacterium avium TaxID=1764 RepID=Q8GE86_MYCAV|nr:recombinase family protein [Mycobacterium avium]AAN05767.1 integrase [Mycobacterium avium subsp. hominissuis A5]ETB29469.1 integrase [Mycobacterium avium subsp. hominissuis 10-4249]
MRFLARVRLSVSTDESTSVERQREIITQWSKLHDHTIVGWAEDIDVSGKLSPFDTPQFGDWLNNRYPEFDGVVAWKLDRLARNMFGLNDLFQWAKANNKTVVSITESLDLSTTVGVMVAQILAGVAQMELEAIQARQSGSQAHLRQVGRWPGGNAPYGYRVVRNGNGCKLDLDPEKAAVVSMIVDRILDGNTMASVCRELNSAGVPAPKGGKWQISTMRHLLRSPALRGHRVHKGQVILGDDGQPVAFGPELVDAETFQRLQAALVPGNGAGGRKNASPLSGLAKCAECGAAMGYESSTGRDHRRRYYYRAKCDHRTAMRADQLEQMAESMLLWHYGDKEITRREWIPGEDHTIALQEAVARYDALSARLTANLPEIAKQRLEKQLEAVEAELGRLSELPQVEGHWAQVGTGRTWNMEWLDADVDQRRAMLREAGMSFLVAPKGARVTLAVNGLPQIDRTEAARRFAGHPVM